MPLNSKEKAKEIGNWYDAAAKFESILSRQNVQYRFQLKPGRTVIFDNHRVLHGRTAFTGLRRICGGYSKCLAPIFLLFSKLLQCFCFSPSMSPSLSPSLSPFVTFHALNFVDWTKSECALVVNMDDFMSRWRNTNMNHEKVVAQVIG